MVEHLTCNHVVASSIPAPGTIKLEGFNYFFLEIDVIVLIDKFLKRTDNFGFGFGGMAEWLKATDCKSVLSEYVGSNPTPSTTVYAVFGVFREVCGCSSVGRALVFQTKCREFEPRRPLQMRV